MDFGVDFTFVAKYVRVGSWKLVYLVLLLGVTGTSIAFVIYGYTGNTKQTNAFNSLPTDLDAISNWINLVGLLLLFVIFIAIYA